MQTSRRMKREWHNPPASLKFFPRLETDLI